MTITALTCAGCVVGTESGMSAVTAAVDSVPVGAKLTCWLPTESDVTVTGPWVDALLKSCVTVEDEIDDVETAMLPITLIDGAAVWETESEVMEASADAAVDTAGDELAATTETLRDPTEIDGEPADATEETAELDDPTDTDRGNAVFVELARVSESPPGADDDTDPVVEEANVFDITLNEPTDIDIPIAELVRLEAGPEEEIRRLEFGILLTAEEVPELERRIEDEASTEEDLPSEETTADKEVTTVEDEINTVEDAITTMGEDTITAEEEVATVEEETNTAEEEDTTAEADVGITDEPMVEDKVIPMEDIRPEEETEDKIDVETIELRAEEDGVRDVMAMELETIRLLAGLLVPEETKIEVEMTEDDGDNIATLSELLPTTDDGEVEAMTLDARTKLDPLLLGPAVEDMDEVLLDAKTT